MNRLIAPILFVLCCVLAAAAQSTEPKTAKWQSFAPADEEFAVEVPDALTEKKFSAETSSRRFFNRVDRTYFFIFADALKDSPQYDFVAKLMNASFFQKKSNQVRKPVAFGEIRAEKIAYTDVDNFHHTTLLVKTDKRAYVFQTVSPEISDAAAARFFESLKIRDKVALEFALKESAATVAETGNEKQKEFEISGNASSTPPESENNKVLSLQDLSASQNNSSYRTRNLKIINKRRAEYNETARFYEIEGEVHLRVHFLAGGTIGAVSAVQKLPFGLTSIAIEAAKNMTFEPAMKNGFPVSVTKTVEYVFIIS